MADQETARESRRGTKTVPGAESSVDFQDLNAKFGDTGEYQLTFDSSGRYRQLVKTGGDQTVQYFLYVYPDGKNWDILTPSQYVSQVKKDNGSNLEGLRKRLFETGFFANTSDYNNKDSNAFTTAILKAGNVQTVEQVDNFLIEKKTQLSPFESWVAAKPASASGEPTRSMVQSTEADAGERINDFIQQLLDRPATDEEKKLFFGKIKAAEKLAVVTRKTSGSTAIQTGSLLDEDDYRQIAFDTVKTTVQSMSDEEIGKGTGALSQSVSSLKEYASQYGINLSNREAFNQVMGGMVQGGTLSTGKLDSQQQAIKNMAKAFYPNLSGIIDGGGTVSGISDQFASVMARTLEIPANSITVFDKRIQKALANTGKQGVMSTTDFEVLLRNEPEWARTKNAKEEAASYATSILQSFGVMA